MRRHPRLAWFYAAILAGFSSAVDIILDRVAFGGVRELQEIYTD